MAERMVAYCGLVCTDCEAYLATQADDWEALEKLAVRARQEYGMVDATAEGSRCNGCLAVSGSQIAYCDQCGIRACARERDLPNCAHCPDYACEQLTSFFAMAHSQAVLDEIRQGLGL